MMKNLQERLISLDEPPIIIAAENSLDERALNAMTDESRFLLFTIDGLTIKSKEDLFDQTASALKFPDYFGHNWDALLDCMRDLDWWLPAKGYCLRYKNPDRLISNSKQDFKTFTEIARYASEFWRSQGVRFVLILEVKEDGNFLADEDLT